MFEIGSLWTYLWRYDGPCLSSLFYICIVQNSLNSLLQHLPRGIRSNFVFAQMGDRVWHSILVSEDSKFINKHFLFSIYVVVIFPFPSLYDRHNCAIDFAEQVSAWKKTRTFFNWRIRLKSTFQDPFLLVHTLLCIIIVSGGSIFGFHAYGLPFPRIYIIMNVLFFIYIFNKND